MREAPPMWFGLWPSMDRHPDFQRFYMQEPKLPPDGTVWDAEAGKLVPARREVTVARSTRAMPERKR